MRSVTFITDWNVSRADAETIRQTCGRVGKCGSLTKAGRRWAFTFSWDEKRNPTLPVWLMFEYPVEIIREP